METKRAAMNVRNIISVFIVSCLFFIQKTNAQTASIQAIEDSLIVNADSMYNAFIPDLRQRHCETFIKQLVRALKNPNSYNYPFEKLGKHISIIQPEDKKFRMFNWVVAVSNVNVRYYGAIQMPGEALKLYPLADNSTDIDDLETAILNEGKWFGAIYYDIITQQLDGKDIYTLIGKNSSSLTSNRKVLEPMVLTDKGVVFGAPIFRLPGKAINRFVLEYRKDISASMKWDKEYGAITFDRLTSQMNDPKRKNTYVPTGQYDGFRWDGSKWSFMEDVIPVQVFKDGEAPAPQPKAVKE